VSAVDEPISSVATTAVSTDEIRTHLIASVQFTLVNVCTNKTALQHRHVSGRIRHRGSTGPAEPLLRTTATTNMAAANFVVITNGEGCAITGTTDIDQ